MGSSPLVWKDAGIAAGIPGQSRYVIDPTAHPIQSWLQEKMAQLTKPVEDLYDNTIQKLWDSTLNPNDQEAVHAALGMLGQGGPGVTTNQALMPHFKGYPKEGRTPSQELIFNKLKEKYPEVVLNQGPINLYRNQQEPVDYPVSQSERGGIFATLLPHPEAKPPTMYKKESTYSRAEGGPHEVKFQYEPKKPLVLLRPEEQEFVGPGVVRTLASKQAMEDLMPVEHHLPFNPDRASELFNGLTEKYPELSGTLTPEDFQAISSSRDPKTQLYEKLGSQLARKENIDSIIALRPQTKITQRPVSEVITPKDELKQKFLGNAYLRSSAETSNLRSRYVPVDPRGLKSQANARITPGSSWYEYLLRDAELQDNYNTNYNYDNIYRASKSDRMEGQDRLRAEITNAQERLSSYLFDKAAIKQTRYLPNQVIITDPEVVQGNLKRYLSERASKSTPANFKAMDIYGLEDAIKEGGPEIMKHVKNTPYYQDLEANNSSDELTHISPYAASYIADELKKQWGSNISPEEPLDIPSLSQGELANHLSSANPAVIKAAKFHDVWPKDDFGIANAPYSNLSVLDHIDVAKKLWGILHGAK